jgi:hypothetical protein
MKNSQKGFVVPLLIVIIALLVIGGGVYVYENKKVGTPVVIDNATQQSDQVQQTNTQNPSVSNPKNTPIIKTIPTSNPVSVRSSITVSSPNGGENYIAGNVITVKWTSNNVPTTNVANVSLVREDGEYSGVTVDSQASANIASGIFNYTPPVTLPTGQYKIAVYSCPSSTGKQIDCTTGDYSDAPFMIKNIASPSTVTPNSLSITVISPSAGSVLQVGQPYKISWSGHFERGDEVFGINSFPVGSDTFGTIATVPIAQASCTGGGMGQWANLSTCSYTWTPTGPTPKLQISVFNNKNGDQFGSSGIFSVSSATSIQPIINYIYPNPAALSLRPLLTINGSNLNPTAPASNKYPRTVYIKNIYGQVGILTEGMPTGSNSSNSFMTRSLSSPICMVSEYGLERCPTAQLMTINPGQYSVYLQVDGGGTSNSIPLTVTN